MTHISYLHYSHSEIPIHFTNTASVIFVVDFSFKISEQVWWGKIMKTLSIFHSIMESGRLRQSSVTLLFNNVDTLKNQLKDPGIFSHTWNLPGLNRHLLGDIHEKTPTQEYEPIRCSLQGRVPSFLDYFDGDHDMNRAVQSTCQLFKNASCSHYDLYLMLANSNDNNLKYHIFNTILDGY